MSKRTRNPLLAAALFCVSCLGLSASASAQEATPIAPPPRDADLELAERVEEVLTQLDGMDQVDVSARVGVIHLSGPVLETAQAERAVEIASGLDGVVAVESELAVDRDLRRRLMPIWENTKEDALQWAAGIPIYLIALVVIWLFWWLGGVVARREGLTRRWARNAFIAEFLKLVLRWLIFFVGLLFALEIVGATAFLGSVLGALGLAGLAVGIAVRDTVENFIASLLLSVRQPFAPQDHVLIEGYEGRVARLTSRATILMTLDGNHVRIPNALVYKGTIVNYTRNPNRRFDFEVGVDTEKDPQVAQSVALDTLQQMDQILVDPSPLCLVQELGDSNVVLRVFGWVNQTQADFSKTRSLAISKVKRAFEERDIGMPEPIYNVRLGQGGLTVTAQPTGLSKPASADLTAPLAPIPSIAEEDTAPDQELERQADLYAGGEDLLDEKAPQE